MPLKVRVCVPVPALWATVIVAVAVAGSVPSSETEDGEIAQVVPPGAPLQESEMLPVRPPRGVMVNVYVPEVPREMVLDAGVAEMEKSVMD